MASAAVAGDQHFVCVPYNRKALVSFANLASSSTSKMTLCATVVASTLRATPALFFETTATKLARIS
jgi:hypothetical protein